MGSCFFLKKSNNFSKSDVLTTKNGQLQGKSFVFDGGKIVNAFLGIPYGKPPVGELRFKKPEPAKPWDGIKDCTKFGPSCPYEDLALDKIFYDGPKIRKDEDCLYLNVFAPSWKSGNDQSNGFAILVFIHGGGFAIHTSGQYGDYGICKGLCTKDVIVVTINYRLGFFGFFSTGDENAKGNFGLWDQVLALKWIKENIYAFGGDPNNITVFGHSAGGVSVDLLALSPHSRELFQKMYCLAGTAVCRSIISTPERIRNTCLDFAQQCGYKPSEDDDDLSTQNVKLLDFFLRLSPEKLAIGITGKKGYKLGGPTSGGLALMPCVDGDFLPKSLDELRKEIPKKIVLNGVTEKEGMFMLYLNPPKGDLKKASGEALTSALVLRKVHNIEEVKKKLLSVYVKGVDNNNKKQLLETYVDIIGDVIFLPENWEFCVEMVKNGHTVYQYLFEYVHPNCFGKLKSRLPVIKSSHGTELPYIFNKGVFSKFFPKQMNEMRMADVMTNYVANFAKYGDPNGNKNLDGEYWEPLSSENTTRYLKINLPKSTMQDNIHQGRMKAWSQILQEDKLQN